MHACGNWLHDLPLYVGLAVAWFGMWGRSMVAVVRGWTARKS